LHAHQLKIRGDGFMAATFGILIIVILFGLYMSGHLF
jgi:hypothetical protein